MNADKAITKSNNIITKSNNVIAKSDNVTAKSKNIMAEAKNAIPKCPIRLLYTQLILARVCLIPYLLDFEVGKQDKNSAD